ncbi:GspH/FimT family protein [Shewanella schlegeliana]|uniref:Type II secretion system protein H n=1 Tax=Shewanella schlegeliana TaxID=190308 RepID=A0ABS1SVR9_9GAMM|nr:GspH/FimT family protein [Shewanella schlegeliana]MBL4912125.1 GspH/FimT family protein [Shewanella schlegeliana]MCL1110789.1 GspH/FimT family protein [Shewanella schlegeliana]GIU22942.1 type IV minor pilin protein FimT [Shewanella schlegeliana]
MKGLKKRIRAFTLVELIVTIAVAAILIIIAAPSFTAFYENARSDAAIRNIQQSLQLARNQAISYGVVVTVCPLNGNTCGTDWRNGFSVFIDNGTLATIDSTNGVDDKVIKVIDAFNSNDFVSYDENSISFSPDGLTTGALTSGRISYCPGSKSNENTKTIEIIRSGKIRFAGTATSCS